MDPTEFIRKGTVVATIFNGSDFRLCRLEESAFMYADRNFSISWLEQTNVKFEYILSEKAKIPNNLILCCVNIQSISRFKFKISKEVEEFIHKEIKFYNEELPTLPIEEINIVCNSSVENNVLDDTAENLEIFEDSGSDYIPSPQQKRRNRKIRGNVIKKRKYKTNRESTSSSINSSRNTSSSFNETHLANSTGSTSENSFKSTTVTGPKPTEPNMCKTGYNGNVNNNENIISSCQSLINTTNIDNLSANTFKTRLESTTVRSPNSRETNDTKTGQNSNLNNDENIIRAYKPIAGVTNLSNSAGGNFENGLGSTTIPSPKPRETHNTKSGHTCNVNNNEDIINSCEPLLDVANLASSTGTTLENSLRSTAIPSPKPRETNTTNVGQNSNVNNNEDMINSCEPLLDVTNLASSTGTTLENSLRSTAIPNPKPRETHNTKSGHNCNVNNNEDIINSCEPLLDVTNLASSTGTTLENSLRSTAIPSPKPRETNTTNIGQNSNVNNNKNTIDSCQPIIDATHLSKSTGANCENSLGSTKKQSPKRRETNSAQTGHNGNINNNENIISCEPLINKGNNNKQKKIGKKSGSTSLINILSAKTINGTRVYDKYHVCFICNETCLKMARHLELKHAQHIEVARVLAKEKKSKERKEGFSALLRAGDFYHNMEVLTHKDGNLILVRRPANRELTNFSYYDFGPCPYCLGFMQKRMLWMHVKACTKVKNDEPCKNVRLESEAIINSILHTEEPSFVKNILNSLKNDHISDICKSDALIRGLGVMLYEKHCGTQNDLIRQTMRQCGRLLDTIRANNELYTYKDLRFFIAPEHFDIIINAVRILCKTTSNDHEKTEYGIPSLALKISHSLRKGVGFLRGQALRAGLIQEDQKLKSFLELMDIEWAIRISTHALSTITKNKMNAAKVLPLTSDLIALNKFLTTEIDVFKTLLKNNPAETDAWYRLAEAVLARVILFNKRRSGETSRLTLQQYSSSPQWDKTSSEELLSTLSEYEKQLANRLKLVQIMGKRGRIVPVLLTEEMVEGINLLISTRITVGVEPNNKYVFSRPNQSLSHIRGSDALRNIIGKCELKEPKSITGTNLRKYVATVAQVFALKDNELDWLARHLGHDIRVHRDFYRLHESAIELTKISRLLMAVDEGVVSQFKGKTMDEINVKDLPDIEIDSDEDDPVGTAHREENSCKVASNLEQETSNINQTKIANDEMESDSSEDYQCNKKPTLKRKKGKKKSVPKLPWSSDEMKAVTSFFSSHIKRGVVPGKKDCDASLAKYPVLQRRNWSAIKFCVKNYISKVKKASGNK